MFVCAHYEEVAKKVRQIPLAVPVAWFLLGGLLLTFNFWLLTLTGVGLLMWSGKNLVFRSRLALCCLKKRRRAMEQGEIPAKCFEG
jgi:hypothetical protein